MIYGERIRLRATEREDISQYTEWLNDPDVTAGMGIYFPMSVWDETRWFDGLSKRSVEERALAIEMKTTEGGWKHIGSTGFDRIEWVNSTAEFGIFIGEKSLWNQGYGSEATHLMLKHGFETLNLNRIFLHVYETNPRAIHAYEKAGFVKEGLLREAIFRNGCYINVLLMSVLRSEWNSIHKK